MKSERSFYCPPELVPQIGAVTWDINHAYFSSFPEAAIDLKDKVTVQKSLRAFAKDMNGGRINELLDQHKKDNDFSPKGNFVLTVPEYGVDHKGLGNEIECWFNIDGMHSMWLGWWDENPQEPLWLAVTSFNCGSIVYGHRDPSLKFTYPFPIILQIQGPHKEIQTYPLDNEELLRKKALATLGNYRWERALIRLVIEWALRENIPALYLLPGSMHRIMTGDSNNKDKIADRLHIRYDVSAERCGFRLQRNGLYGISLLLPE